MPFDLTSPDWAFVAGFFAARAFNVLRRLALYGIRDGLCPYRTGDGKWHWSTAALQWYDPYLGEPYGLKKFFFLMWL